MKLAFLPLDKLGASKANMRSHARAPDVTDLLSSVRARGVLVPILVRPADDDRFEIVAGRRRHAAACLVAEERRAGGSDEAEPMPCAIIEAGDDAAALEASLIENIARLDPDEVTRWETFTALVRKGRSIDDLATTFGLPELMIRRTLALGNLLPRIRTLYRDGRIDGTTVRHLTLASKSQQKAWLALLDDDDGWCPTGHQLKAWLFGGQSIPTAHALFDPATCPGGIVSDLFGEGGYFADADRFWTAQNEAIAARRQAFLDAGWSDAVIVPPSEHFHLWEYEKAAKRKGGRVYIDVRATGEVIVHEGYVSRKEAQRLARGEAAGGDRPPRPELTGAIQTYVDLHRHAAVRADLLAQPGVALRLMVAHVIAGSPLWVVKPEPQATRNEAIRESVERCPAEAHFDERRRAVLEALGLSSDAATVVGADEQGITGLMPRLLELPDPVVMEVVACLMGETLAAGGAVIELVGQQIGTDMARWWRADDALFDLIRDREVLCAIVAEVAGERIAAANRDEKGKTLKAVVRAHLDGADGRTKVEGWVPRWMRFAPCAYTARGGVGTVSALRRVEAIRASSPDDDPDPNDEAGGEAAAGTERRDRLAA